ncbi:hypothetical protein AB0M68_38135 [Streptomyces sp. NPDC051453]|uniref:hypothetical protein n=1 Tax=Streptomyces sp. NPDC051453 TaxID=3154941 RepID=UPI00342588ED
MEVAPIIVHSPYGGRTADGWSYGQILGLAYLDGDVIEFPAPCGPAGAEELLDNP